MGKLLSESEVERFRQQGVVFPLTALTQEEVLTCRKRVESLLDESGRIPKELNAFPHILSAGQGMPVQVNERDIVDILLEPGQFSIRDVQLIHGSDPNRSNDLVLLRWVRMSECRIQLVQDARCRRARLQRFAQ